MGWHAEIYFESEGKPSRIYLPSNLDCVLRSTEFANIRELWFCESYYDIEYERGSWPAICGMLMSLFASPEVKRVWYLSDHFNFHPDEIAPITPENVLNLSRHYMTEDQSWFQD